MAFYNNTKEDGKAESPCQWLHLNNDAFLHAGCLSFTGQLFEQCVYTLLKKIVTYCALAND